MLFLYRLLLVLFCILGLYEILPWVNSHDQNTNRTCQDIASPKKHINIIKQNILTYCLMLLLSKKCIARKKDTFFNFQCVWLVTFFLGNFSFLFFFYIKCFVDYCLSFIKRFPFRLDDFFTLFSLWFWMQFPD